MSQPDDQEITHNERSLCHLPTSDWGRIHENGHLRDTYRRNELYEGLSEGRLHGIPGYRVTYPLPTRGESTKMTVSVTLTDEMGFRKGFPRGGRTECRDIVSHTHLRLGIIAQKGLYP